MSELFENLLTHVHFALMAMKCSRSGHVLISPLHRFAQIAALENMLMYVFTSFVLSTKYHRESIFDIHFAPSLAHIQPFRRSNDSDQLMACIFPFLFANVLGDQQNWRDNASAAAAESASSTGRVISQRI